MHLAYIALGSNLGNRREYLEQALAALNEHSGIVVKQVSSFHETAPVGGPSGQGAYLNAAAELETDLEPRALLQAFLEIEQTLGRVRQERFGPRTIDLDLLLYNALVCQESDLIVPHPRMHERLFVLEPLAEIAAQAVHPLRNVTVSELLAEAKKQQMPAAVNPESARSEVPTDDKSGGRELAGLRAVVTGSTSGIGRAIARELATGGADVLVHRKGLLPLAEKVSKEILALGVHSSVVVADLRQPEECYRLVETAWNLWQGVDIWINNAGADTLTGEAGQWPFERKLQELLAVDVTATMLLSRGVGERMKARGSGVILNMGWDQADTGMEGDSGQLFAASKAAVMAFSKSLALSLAPEVRVNCLAPGWIQTAWGEKASAGWQERVKRETPLGRWGLPEDVAKAARWLVSPAGAFITGQVIRVNGGAVR
jgi:3-oxoacyl-[acyl-carrier protein] reductase